MAGQLFIKMTDLKVYSKGASMRKDKVRKKEEKLKAKQLKNKKQKIINSTLQVIPYENFIEDNITYLGNDTYSKTYKFRDVNYNLGTTDEKEIFLEMYSKILNSFSEKCENIQLVFINEKANKEEFIKKILPKTVNGIKEIQEQLNKVIIDKINSSRNKNLIKKNRYIVVSIKDTKLENVKRNFSFIDEDLKNSFATLNSKLEVVTNYEKTLILSKIYRNKDNLNWYKNRDGKDFNYKMMEEKMHIASSYMKFSPKNFETDGKKITSFVMRDLASYLSDQFLSEILGIQSELIFTINIKTINSAKAQKIIQNKLNNLRANKLKKEQKAWGNNFSGDLITMEIEDNIKKTEEYSKDLIQFDQKLFQVNFLTTLISDDENFESVVETYKNVINRNICETDLAFFQQEAVFNSCIPIGRNDVKISRYINTNGLTAFVPFDIKSMIDETGFYCGTNLRNEIIMLNRKKLMNLNGFILGSSGSGKSFSAKQDIQNVISYTNDDIVIVDPEREYKFLVEENKGETINISNTSKNHINLLEIFYDENSDIDTIIEEKCGFLHSVLNLMLGGQYGLEPEELSLLDKHLGIIYRKYLRDVENNKMPTLTDLYNALNNDISKYSDLSQNLALSLDLYVSGSLKIFNNETNVDINNRIVCFDIKDLNGKLKTLGLLVILDNIWARVMKNHKIGKSTWIIIDEIHLLFKDKQTLAGLENAYKRFRKYGALTTGITQNITDLFHTKEASTMLSNSEYVKILGQSQMDKDKIINLYGLTKNQADYISSVEPGKGLIKFGDVIIPYEDIFPKNNEIFKMFDTNPYKDSN